MSPRSRFLQTLKRTLACFSCLGLVGCGELEKIIDDNFGTTTSTGGEDEQDDEGDTDSEDDSAGDDESSSDEDVEELNCVVALAEDFCWYEFVREIADCSSGVKDSGEFDVERETCVFDDGSEIRFAEPVPASGTESDEYLWSFDVYGEDGRMCTSLRDRSDGVDGWKFELKVGPKRGEISKIGTVRRVQCPNGKVYGSPDDRWLGDCPGVAPRIQAWSVADDSNTVVECEAQPNNVRVFECLDAR